MTSFVKAIKIERARDESGNPEGWRAIMFEISRDDGIALVLSIVEAGSAREAGTFLCEGFPDEALAVKVDPSTNGRTDDAEKIGNHYVVWPDALSTVEVAELFAA